MGRDTGFELYGPEAALRQFVEDAPEWVRADERVYPLDGGKAQFEILYWRNRSELASRFARYFGKGDSSHPMARWAGDEFDEFIGVCIPYDDIHMIPELLVDFVKGQDWSESPDARWFLERFGLDLGRAVYWSKIRSELQAAGVEVVWYDSY